MGLLDRVESLKAKHAALEVALDDESRRPSPDYAAVAELKRKKLKIKDELERIVPN
ncbi:MAG TPA: DUF465 domain-containing protein [Rhodospirillaceae bacterium]|nr:DUF465 domain-containing protein [Rhodospirillaceae bacterium]